MEAGNLKLFFVISNQSYLDLSYHRHGSIVAELITVHVSHRKKQKIISLLLSAVKLYWNMIQVKFFLIFYLYICNLLTPGYRVLSKCCGESGMCRE